MHFETVFDLAEVGYKSWWFPAFGLILLPLAAAFIFFPSFSRLFNNWWLSSRWRRILNWFGLIFVVGWTIATFFVTFSQYITARDALKSARFDVVEGPVTSFKTTPKSETFTVSYKTFSYSDFMIAPGFNNIRSQGGPIRTGIYVRVTYTDNTILRLEIAR